MSDKFEDRKVRECLARCSGYFFDEPDAPLRVDEGSFLLAPAGCWQDEIRHLCRLGIRVHVLHHEKIESIKNVVASVLIDPRVGGVRADHPQTFDLPSQDAFDDFGIRKTVLVGNSIRVDSQDVGDRVTMRGVLKVTSAEQIGRVAKQSRAHRVALAGDRIGTRAGPTDVARDQGQINDRLCGANSLVALIDSHRPPKRHTLPCVDRFGESM